MMRTAYFDLANGISGDMILAALAYAGRRMNIAVERAITDAVASLDLGCTVSFVDDERGGLACVRAEVKTDDSRHSPSVLRDAIRGADATPAAKQRAVRALDLLVDAEAAVHRTAPEDVHLHELASADTAADLLGAAVGIESLVLETIAAAPVPVPVGWMRSEHGPLPLPAPVVLELLTGAAVRGDDSATELVTPSGIAVLRAHDATFGPSPDLTIEAVGVGGGARNTERPNICRVLIGEAAAHGRARVESCTLLETNIDDQTPEGIAHALETLIERGALDAWITPIVMKKSRPAFQLSVLARPADEAMLAEVVFRETTTLGIRRRRLERDVLEREHIVVRVRGHDVRVKIGRLGAEVVNVAPEFADCAAAARVTGTPLEDISNEAMSVARSTL